jgi:hypothetical protein
MSRERYQRGSLKKIGKTRKMWRGRWHVYIRQLDGSERLCKRERILGAATELTRVQAQEKLDSLIRAATSQISSDVPSDPTFAEVWDRYATLKAATWSTATRKAVTSVFASRSEDRLSVLALIGSRRVRELTRDPLQTLINQMAERGDSYSAVERPKRISRRRLNTPTTKESSPTIRRGSSNSQVSVYASRANATTLSMKCTAS